MEPQCQNMGLIKGFERMENAARRPSESDNVLSLPPSGVNHAQPLLMNPTGSSVPDVTNWDDQCIDPSLGEVHGLAVREEPWVFDHIRKVVVAAVEGGLPTRSCPLKSAIVLERLTDVQPAGAQELDEECRARTTCARDDRMSPRGFPPGGFVHCVLPLVM